MQLRSNKVNFLLRYTRGFTAVEMMVVVAILAILAAIAMPSFVEMTETMRTGKTMDEVQGVLLFARSEAVRTRSNVVVRGRQLSDCRPAEGNDAQNWSCGWVVFADANNNNAQDAGEATVREMGELDGVRLIHRGGSSHAFIAFNAMGFANNTPGRFTAQPQGIDDVNRRSVRSLCIGRTANIRHVRGVAC